MNRSPLRSPRYLGDIAAVYFGIAVLIGVFGFLASFVASVIYAHPFFVASFAVGLVVWQLLVQFCVRYLVAHIWLLN
jgi:hypothetical protein